MNPVGRALTLPDVLTDWPWTFHLNPHYHVVSEESRVWLEALHISDGLDQKFIGSNFSLLGYLSCLSPNKNILRLNCDFMSFLFACDEYTDLLGKEEAQSVSDSLLDALQNPFLPRLEGQPVVIEMARQISQRAASVTEPGAPSIQRFLVEFKNYITNVVQEADDRAQQHVRSLEEYITIRRETSAAKPCFCLNDFGLELPEDVIHHPVIAALVRSASELIGLINDMYSYPREQARGLDGHNAITVIMHEHNLDVSGAMEWLGVYARGVVTLFLADLARVPSWGEEVDNKVKAYIDGLGQWVRGCDDWSFETPRYFGVEAPKVKGSRITTLQPHTSCN